MVLMQDHTIRQILTFCLRILLLVFQVIQFIIQSLFRDFSEIRQEASTKAFLLSLSISAGTAPYFKGWTLGAATYELDGYFLSKCFPEQLHE